MGSTPTVPATYLDELINRKNMELNDLPRELVDRLRKEFENDGRIVQMRVRQRELMQTHLYGQAIGIGTEINRLFDRFLVEYMQATKEEVEVIDVNKMPLSDEDRVKLSSLVVAMFMCCDIIESASMDANDIVHKYDRDASIEAFEEFGALAKMAKEKIRYFRGEGSYTKSMVFSDKCDDMYKMLLNKAVSVVRAKDKK